MSAAMRRTAVVVPVLAATLVAASAVVAGATDLVTLVGVAASLAVAVGAVRARHGVGLLGGKGASLATAVAVLALSRAGLDQHLISESWRPALAVVAYPFLGHVLMRLVNLHRRLRETDVLVEAALVGTAVGIVLHVSISARATPLGSSAWVDASSAFPAMLTGLDVALLVLGVRGLRAPDARRGPLAHLHLALVGLAGAHLLQAVWAPLGVEPGFEATALVVAALSFLGVAAAHPDARAEPEQLLEEPVSFSSGHAAVVGAALLAAPGALALQAARGVTPTPTVATGAVLSGMILAGYLLQLLRERGTTEHDATHDGLTLLPNRRLLVDRLDRSIAHAKRSGQAVGLLFIDLDRFKEVNDTFGHAAGDVLLGTVAERLQQCVREEDTVARLSGDEFVVLLPHLTSADEALIVAERALAALGDPVTVLDERLLMAGSVGIAVYPNDGDSAEDLLASADAAMYRAKETPGNHWEVFSPRLATQAQSRMAVEAGLLDGIAREELVLHFQPIVDAPSGRIGGAEGLVRWNHPERGLLSPAEFVPIAERSDLIVLLGERVVLEACRELRRWQDLGLRDQLVSVNIAARHFSRGLVSTVASALRLTGASPHNLIIELTESTIVDNLEAVASTLEELRNLGVRAAIDDFGTGYCGLRYLSVLPVAALKIDRSFIQGMTPSDAAIVGATIAMGHSLGLSIIAEGVETEDQRRFLADQGCDRLQGYLLGRPMAAEELVDRMRAERATVLQGPWDPSPPTGATPATPAARPMVGIADDDDPAAVAALARH